MSSESGKSIAEKRSYFFWLAGQVTKLLPKKSGSRNRFALIVFSEGGKPQFVARANRIDVIRAMRDMANRLERLEVAETSNLFGLAETESSMVATSPTHVPFVPRPVDTAGWNLLREGFE